MVTDCVVGEDMVTSVADVGAWICPSPISVTTYMLVTVSRLRPATVGDAVGLGKVSVVP